MTDAQLLGYADQFSVRPGETIAFMVSSTVGEYQAEIVRLGANEERAEPPLWRDALPGRLQPVAPGSYVFVPDALTLRGAGELTVQAWICPTIPERGHAQGIVSQWSPASETGFALLVEADGHLAFQVGDGSGQVRRVVAPAPLAAGRWLFVAATVDQERGLRLVWHEAARGWVPGDVGEATLTPGPLPMAMGEGERAERTPLLIGALALAPDRDGAAEATGCCNGKIDHPRLWNRALTTDEIDTLAHDAWTAGLDVGLVGDWDFSQDISATTVVDRSPRQAHGVTVNMPMRGVTSHRWDGSAVSFAANPAHYDAIAFHEDDLEDCGWEADFTFAVPPDLPSGLYAARLAGGNQREEIPFYVRPRLGAASAPVLYLAPTNTYLAYANFRLNSVHALAGRTDTPGGGRLSTTDERLMAHPEIGGSVYDAHPDGTGICYSSRLRPILTMRSDAIEAATEAPRHFAADRYLLAWLEQKGFPYDVATDEDLHFDGAALLAPYRVVVTGSHPEYWTGPMLDAVETYLAGGGRLMYLGGNGFYWVTAIDPARPHLIEMRRGTGGTRTWTSAPGEEHLSLTGELGGLWRHRGRTPNRLCGVGFTAQGWDAAAGYQRLPDSFDPRGAFIFAGIGDEEIIGDFGLVLNGAAGDEIDRYDLDLGTPPETLRLATSEGTHSDVFQLVIEDTTESKPDLGGTTCPLVRADMVYLEVPGGGAVFSVGSINWIASLPHNGFANNVSRVTENVLRHFAATRPQ